MNKYLKVFHISILIIIGLGSLGNFVLDDYKYGFIQLGIFIFGLLVYLYQNKTKTI